MGELVICPLPTILHRAAGSAQGSSSDIMAELAEAYRCDLCWTVGQVPDTGVGGTWGNSDDDQCSHSYPTDCGLSENALHSQAPSTLAVQEAGRGTCLFCSVCLSKLSAPFLKYRSFGHCLFLDVSIIEFRRNRRGLHSCVPV